LITKRVYFMVKKISLVLLISLLLVGCRGDEQAEESAAERLTRPLTEGKMGRTQQDMRAITTALQSYMVDYNIYPGCSSIEELSKFLTPHYLTRVPRLDAWGGELIYRSDGRSYQLLSLGPDRKEGTPDDLLLRDNHLKPSP